MLCKVHLVMTVRQSCRTGHIPVKGHAPRWRYTAPGQGRADADFGAVSLDFTADDFETARTRTYRQFAPRAVQKAAKKAVRRARRQLSSGSYSASVRVLLLVMGLVAGPVRGDHDTWSGVVDSGV